MKYKTEDRIPKWIRDNVKWWLENKIDDQTFLLGIEYLVKENIIVMNSNVKNEIDIEEPKKLYFLQSQMQFLKFGHLKMI